MQKPGKVIARCGKRQVGALRSGERGFATTVVACYSASGTAGTLFTNSESGWMTKELFPKYLQSFQHHVKCTKEERVLLVLDGHNSHTKHL